MKAVFDTNVYISGLLFKGGVPSRLFDLARDKRFSLYLSPEILEEFRAVLRMKFEMSLHETDRLVRWIESAAQIVYPIRKIQLVKVDEPDNRILECALESSSEYLVTGDKKHLLRLKHPFGFKIVSPADFYSLLYP
ncbi:MAG: putative toxin-antitoxin system toxin component, PIN family [Deltaproteobacteria bacterium]|nr:putative toxin-antitoxin system toxin component, PIN family [Deltaproteobacteria bacterium]